MHKSQVFGYLLISFLVGVFISDWFVDPIMATLAIVLIGTVVLVGSGYERTFARTKKAERNRRAGVILGACILALALGIVRYGYVNLSHSVLLEFADARVGNPAKGGVKGISVTLRGVVDNQMTTNGDRGQVFLHVAELDVPGQSMKVDERTLLYTKSVPEYKIGDTIAATGTLQRPENFVEGFDYVQYLKNKEIRTVLPSPEIVSDLNVDVPAFQRLKFRIYRPLFAVKDAFQAALRRSMPEPYTSYVSGVLLGARQNIPDDITEAFNKTSTTHVLAISGYNIAIIANVVLGILVFWMRRRWAFWVSVGVIILFTIMTGAGSSVVRAAVMGLLLLFANGYGRLYDPRNSILFAGAVMVFLHPLSLRFDVGFQLSFLAVFGLIYLYPMLDYRFRKIPKLRGLKEILLMSLAAQIMVAPLLAYVFHTFSIVSLPANLLVLPFMPFVMLFGFLAGIGGLLFAPLGQAIGLVAWLISAYQLNIIQWIASLSFASADIHLPTVILIAIYALIGTGIWKAYLIKNYRNE